MVVAKESRMGVANAPNLELLVWRLGRADLACYHEAGNRLRSRASFGLPLHLPALADCSANI